LRRGGEIAFRPVALRTVDDYGCAVAMARATAELGATLLLYAARNVDFCRSELCKRSNQIYRALHLHGNSESLIGREVA
jgi:hypothetical protein